MTPTFATLTLLAIAETARRQSGVPLSQTASVWRAIVAHAPESEAGPFKAALAALEKSDAANWLANYARSLNK